MANDLLRKDVLLLDGGMGTTLEDQHAVVFTNQSLWSSHLLITDTETLSKVQTGFIEAGSDILMTPTYQASKIGFHQTKEATKDYSDYFQTAIELTRNAHNSQNRIVALSLGAYGAVLKPSQEYGGQYGDLNEDVEKLAAFHTERLDMCSKAWDDVDLLAFETLPRLSEVRAVRHAVNNLQQSSKPYWISCVFPNDNFLPDGSSVEDIVHATLIEQTSKTLPLAIGVNCTKVHKVPELIQEFEKAAEKLQVKLPRLVLYPDGAGGLVYDTTTQKWIGQHQDEVTWDEKVFEIVQNVRSRGKWSGIIVGGCCKTTPQHIARLRQRLDEV